MGRPKNSKNKKLTRKEIDKALEKDLVRTNVFESGAYKDVADSYKAVALMILVAKHDVVTISSAIDGAIDFGYVIGKAEAQK